MQRLRAHSFRQCAEKLTKQDRSHQKPGARYETRIVLPLTVIGQSFLRLRNDLEQGSGHDDLVKHEQEASGCESLERGNLRDLSEIESPRLTSGSYLPRKQYADHHYACREEK